MPGLCGFISSSPFAGAAGLLDDMLARLDGSVIPVPHRYVDSAERYVLGAASLGILSKSHQPAVSQDGDRMVVFDGELYDMDAIRAGLLTHGQQIAVDDFAAVLLATYDHGGDRSVAALEGSFAAAMLDLRNQSLTLFSDAFGTRPLYYSYVGGRFVFASRISALLADGGVSRDLDWRGVSQFFTFGHYFNDSTSLSAVKVLPAGAALRFDARTNKTAVARFWTGCERIGPAPRNREEAYTAVDDALSSAVARRSAPNGPRLGLSLSGGLDARTILGLIADPAQRLQTVCLGMAGSRDHQASSQLAGIAGCPHRNHVLDSAFLGDFRRHLENMVRLTDGQYLSQCIVMPTLPLYRELGVEVLLRGHGGELLHLTKAYNYSLDAEASRLAGGEALEAWLWKRLQAYLLDGVDGPLFVRPEGERSQAARESLQQAIADTPNGEPPAQRISHLFIDQRLRRETPLSLMKFRSIVEPRMPYLDRMLVNQLMAMPVDWKLDDELQTFILRKHQPRFCDVENTNTGAGLGAGRLRRKAAGLRAKVFGKLGVPGYQPYERLGLWLRRELAPLVREIVLSDECLERGLFAPDTVHNVVDNHLSGARNHTYLIMAMLVFEVGHRQLFGKRSNDYAVDDRISALTV